MARRHIAMLVALPLLFGGSNAAHPETPSPFAELLALDTPNYTGGLSRRDRDVAEHIRASMAARYVKTCPPSDPRAGELVSLTKDPGEQPQPAPDAVDPDLVTLIRALDDPRQEVRDVAAYTIALLGPSASAAQPTLGRLFSTPDARGGWFNLAFGSVSCQQVVPPDFRRVIPSSMIPADTPWKAFLAASAVLLPKLYVDERYEYPPGMMSHAFENFGLDGESSEVGPLLASILDDGRLSLRKHIEAAQVFAWKNVENEASARPAVEKHFDDADPELRFYIGKALVHLHSPKAIPLVVERISYEDWSGDATRDLCGYGPAAIAAEDRLIDVVRNSTWPRAVAEAVSALGCVHSVKSEPVLTALLRGPDWQLNASAAKAIGQIGKTDPDAVAALEQTSRTHWSAIVRKAAESALVALGYRPAPPPPPPEPALETIVVGGAPQPFDHGLPWCDDKGRYSIDGASWFKVNWREPKLAPPPAGFQARILQGVGTQTFLDTGEGWLFGSDGFEDEGLLAHVSSSGEVSELDERNASIRGIVRAQGHIYAFGFEILKNGDAGSLFDLVKSADGKWRADFVLTLPSAPWSHAIAPTGELLLSDGPNDYAVVNNRIVPLKCERRMPGSFFDKH